MPAPLSPPLPASVDLVERAAALLRSVSAIVSAIESGELAATSTELARFQGAAEALRAVVAPHC